MITKTPYGYWTIKKNCQSEALKYKTRSEFKKNSNAAYQSAYRNGWLDDICKHMIVTKELCLIEALKYETRTEFSNNNPSVYYIAFKNGWLDDICKHMTRFKIRKPFGYWTKELCRIEALKYKSRSEFEKYDRNAYCAAIRNGWLDDICKHMNIIQNLTYTKETCRIVALKYKTRSDFRKKSCGAYQSAYRNGWLDDICSHMPYKIVANRGYWQTVEGKKHCQKIALKYETRNDFKKGNYTEYNASIKNGYISEICQHMIGNDRSVWTQSIKLNLLNDISELDLESMGAFELYVIIQQGKLPYDFKELCNTEANSVERTITLNQLKERYSKETDEDTTFDNDIDTTQLNDNVELLEIDEVDTEITHINSVEQNEKALPKLKKISQLKLLDNKLFSTMDTEAFDSLVNHQLMQLWNTVLDDNKTVCELRNETGSTYFTRIKTEFLTEYEHVIKYKPKKGYAKPFEPNLMQKLIVNRLLKYKSYGNWSGTGAGKTLSFILASREVDSKLTLVVALNSTIKQISNEIKDTYKDSIIYTEYKKGQVFDMTKHNYIILNYEKFQLQNSEALYQDLTNNHKIEFVMIDEVQNAKQRTEGIEFESIRRGVLTRMVGRIREKNHNLYTLVMSATPVINDLYEAISILQLLTGLDYKDLNTTRTLYNALMIYQQIILNGLRYIPTYDININEEIVTIDGNHLLEDLLSCSNKNYVEIEKVLLEDKLKAVESYIAKGTIIYTHLTTDFVNTIKKYFSNKYKIEAYTGEESSTIRENILDRFKKGKIDILIGSKPIGTGVDGLQTYCNNMIMLTLPWTHAEYVQLIGRIYRQGSSFKNVNIIIPQVRLTLDNNEIWSWDIQRLNLIKNKKTLADAAVDGLIPSSIIPKPSTMYKKSIESLNNWKDRINNGDIIHNDRLKLDIDLYPDISDEIEREKYIISELSEFNRRGKVTLSTTLNKEFNENPDRWFRYHKLRNERLKYWGEIPYEYIATKIKNKNHKIIDFGCGMNLFKNCVPNNEVISFDHIAIDDTVIACDIKDISAHVYDETIDVAVFSLALWGTNYVDYFKEAYRVLNYGGVVHIAEPLKNYTDLEDEQNLINMLNDIGFTMVGDTEKKDRFIYMTAIKI